MGNEKNYNSDSETQLNSTGLHTKVQGPGHFFRLIFDLTIRKHGPGLLAQAKPGKTVGMALRAMLALFLTSLALMVYRIALALISPAPDPFLAHTALNISALVLIVLSQELGPLLVVWLGYYLLANFSPAIIKTPVRVLSVLLLAVWTLYRGINLMHVYYTGINMDRTIIDHADASFIPWLADIRSMAVIAGAALFTVALSFVLRRLDFSSEPPVRRVLALFILVAVALTASHTLGNPGKRWGMSLKVFSRIYPAASHLPERMLLHSYSGSWGQSWADLPPPELQEGLAREMQHLFGTALDPDAPLPLFRKNIYSDPFPYAAKAGSTEQPNVIVIMMESLSAPFVGHFGNPYPNITPNIDSFAKEAMDIGPVYGATIPTAKGVISTLCSIILAERPINMARGRVSKYDLLCLPEVLKSQGYNTYDIDPGNAYYGTRRVILEANGLDTFLGRKEITEHLKEDNFGEFSYSVSDHQVFRFLADKLENGQFAEPFLMSMLSIDMHPPANKTRDSIAYTGSDKPLLQILHSTDDAFGIFWRWFRKSRYADNTIVVLTADHPIFRMDVFEDIPDMAPDTLASTQTVPFLVYDPTHDLPKRLRLTASSLDITPSLLHLLGINIENPFDGLSVFDPTGRPAHPNVLGVFSSRLFYRINNSDHSAITSDLDCKGKTEKGFSACKFLSWLNYRKWLLHNDLIWSPGTVPDHIRVD